VTNSEYLDFVRDGGYERADLWLSEGFRLVHEGAIRAPLYWLDEASAFHVLCAEPLRPEDPVCHVSYFEADAFARWAGARLPSEAEWEIAASSLAVCGNLLEEGALCPRPAGAGAAAAALEQMFGDGWEWTQSAYAPYPGFQPFGGALASTTESSCLHRWCYGEGRVSRQRRTCGPAIEISFPRAPAGR